ncbi:hypothetical protein H0H81_005086 [Sphagnurus paluster]|uniref:Peptide hydrolase n=1 Tax=Sphagnurus paluster TaxID=117069 RepID=A0A9P7K707_9AGAR|nr:hypothetical protein H0H81_005086 [Sphagnurus paluster]
MRFESTFNLVLAAVALVAHAVPIISPDEIAVKSGEGLRLLSLAEDVEPVWKTEDEKLELMRAGIKFFDVTEVYDQEQKFPPKNNFVSIAATFPAPSHQAELAPILKTVSTTNMQTYLSALTAFNNRYYKSSTGTQASNWILDTVKSITSGRSDITASLFSHSWGQPSIVVKIAGKSPSSPVTIVGAHMDSINLSNPTNGRAPGADDDGTGTVNLIEGLRVLVAAGFKPSTPVEFHWYSGEESGLLGSQAIATSYKSSGVQVKAFMELDMSGYFKPGTTEVMALQADYIDEGLNTFLKSLITAYSRIPWAMDKPIGVPSSFPYEAVTGNDNPNIHSASDTTSVNGFSWAHSLEFAKIGVAFVYELSV